MSTVYIPPGRLSALPLVLKANLHGSLLMIVLNDLRRVIDNSEISKEKNFFTNEDTKVKNKSFRYQAVRLDNVSTNVTSINTKFYRVIHNEALLILYFC